MISLHFKDIFDVFDVKVNDIEYFIEVFKSHYFDFIDSSALYPNALETLDLLKKE